MRNRFSVFAGSPTAAPRQFRHLLAVLLALLAVEFLAGMVVNLFATVPATHPGRDAPEYFSGIAQGIFWALVNAVASLRLHVLVGLLLFLAGLWLLVRAIAARRRGWIIVAAVGLVGILAAGFNGASFLNYGFDISSLLMTIGFLLAAVAYVIGYGMPDVAAATR